MNVGQFSYMKISILLTGLAIISVMTILYFNVHKKQPETAVPTPTEINATNTPTTEPNTPSTEKPTGKIKADTFTGILQAVNTGCFSDGECSVTVDGKHVTVLMGWSQDTVGTIIGAPSIGDLEAFIGKPVEIYARDNADGTYSLYGSEGFYIKVLGETASSTLPTTITGTSTATVADGCMIGGCSGQLCVEKTDGNVASTCMFNPQYACYKTAECKRQTSGQCGWTKTPTLAACLANPVEKRQIQ